MDEYRRASRRRILKAGAIGLRGGGAISCTVRSLSAAGAALEVFSPLDIPGRFKLVIQADNVNRPCHVIWRKQRRIGVAFWRTTTNGSRIVAGRPWIVVALLVPCAIGYILRPR